MLATRKLLGREKFGHEIHFVVADNAAFYNEVPVSKTHTPIATQLARYLNAVGNKHGVFVHYITPNEMKFIFPRELTEPHPLGHINGKNQLKTSPGAATNIALSYIRGYHHEKHRGLARAFLLRISDDVFPPTSKTVWGEEARQYRNFFLDQEKMFDGPISGSRKRYRGYDDSSGRRLRKEISTFSFLVRFGDLRQFPYYGTAGSEDRSFSFS